MQKNEKIELKGSAFLRGEMKNLDRQEEHGQQNEVKKLKPALDEKQADRPAEFAETKTTEKVIQELSVLLSPSLLTAELEESKQRKLDRTANTLRKNFFHNIACETKTENLNEIDSAQLFIPPLMANVDELCGDAGVWNKVNQFLSGPQKSLLILGNAGQGKTLLLKMLTKQLWLDYASARLAKKIGPIPLYIYLPRIKQPDKLLSEFFLDNGINPSWMNVLKLLQQPLLLLLDGFDEIKKPINFYQENHWHEWNVRIITACRPEIFHTEKNYTQHFYPGNLPSAKSLFMELSLDLFNESQINEYIQRYLHYRKSLITKPDLAEEEDWNVVATYMHYLKAISGLLELTRTPVVLAMLMPIFPRVVSTAQKTLSPSPASLASTTLEVTEPIHENEEKKLRSLDRHKLLEAYSKYASTEEAQQMTLTRAKLYDSFTYEWFATREKPRLVKTIKQINPDDIVTYCQIYTENLAYQALRRGLVNGFFTEEVTLNPDLLKPHDIKRCPHYVDDLKKLNDTGTLTATLKALRSACLLKVADGEFSFMHKSLVEYFTSKELFTSIYVAAEYYARAMEQEASARGVAEAQQLLHFNQYLLVDFPQILQFLADRVQEDPTFKAMLWELVYLSKTEIRASIAAANAITILNYANEIFSHKNLQGIRIPGADLSNAICEGTQFQNADLRRVRFHNAWLSAADFTKAILAEVQFGGPVILKETLHATCCAYSPNSYWLAIGNNRGYVHLYETVHNQLVTSISWWTNRINDLAFNHTSEYLVAGSEDGYLRLWDVTKRCLLWAVFAYSGGVSRVTFHPKGIQIASSGFEKKKKLILIEKMI